MIFATYITIHLTRIAFYKKELGTDDLGKSLCERVRNENSKQGSGSPSWYRHGLDRKEKYLSLKKLIMDQMYSGLETQSWETQHKQATHQIMTEKVEC